MCIIMICQRQVQNIFIELEELHEPEKMELQLMFCVVKIMIILEIFCGMKR